MKMKSAFLGALMCLLLFSCEEEQGVDTVQVEDWMGLYSFTQQIAQPDNIMNDPAGQMVVVGLELTNEMNASVNDKGQANSFGMLKAIVEFQDGQKKTFFYDAEDVDYDNISCPCRMIWLNAEDGSAQYIALINKDLGDTYCIDFDANEFVLFKN